MLNSFFRRRPAVRTGDSLYAAAVAQARRPDFYTVLGAADRIDARFELYTLHVLLLVLRLRDEPGQGAEAGAEAAQSLFDVYVSALDHALRELGVGDVSMARKMRNLGEALYGRMTAYEAPVRAHDEAGLARHLARNVYESDDPERAAALARYALETRSGLARQSLAEVVANPRWPEIAP